MSVHKPADAYTQQLRVRRTALFHPDDLRNFDEQQVMELVNWYCTQRNGNSPESEHCPVAVERDEHNRMVIPTACEECRRAVYADFHNRWSPVVQLG